MSANQTAVCRKHQAGAVSQSDQEMLAYFNCEGCGVGLSCIQGEILIDEKDPNFKTSKMSPSGNMPRCVNSMIACISIS